MTTATLTAPAEPTAPENTVAPTITVQPTTIHPSRYATAAQDHGAAPALALLHTETSPGVLPTGPAGHALVPRTVAESCDIYDSLTGPLRHTDDPHSAARTPLGAADLIWLHISGAGPRRGTPHPSAWETGIAWIRLGLAERLLARAAGHLRGREVQGTVTLNLPLVRANIADAACGIAEARALLSSLPSHCTAPDHDTDDSTACSAGTDALTLRAAHRGLDESVRHCLRLFGAWGFLTDGPGGEARAFELLGDAYAPATDPSTSPPPASAPDRSDED